MNYLVLLLHSFLPFSLLSNQCITLSCYHSHFLPASLSFSIFSYCYSNFLLLSPSPSCLPVALTFYLLFHLCISIPCCCHHFLLILASLFMYVYYFVLLFLSLSLSFSIYVLLCLAATLPFSLFYHLSNT